ncbi:MAG: carbamoyl-phosphate synthase large subunit [Candidatus Improbicoccus devescovinae]|nr:MAG: carbamoyl-phosphate synthase large subunit [Candidatus Improbicoccus devescovinae]
MPLRQDIRKILIIGSGPIVIGQAAEFDYSGTQACLALRELNFETVLINSNPASIMTDFNVADKIYMEPLTLEYVIKILRKEKPDALLATLGGQTSLNLAVDLHASGVLEEIGCEIIGTSIKAIEKSENREKFKQFCTKLGLACVESEIAHTYDEILNAALKIGFPVILRPAFTLGGTGGGFVNDINVLKALSKAALDASPISQVLIEKSVKGYKEIEYEVIRDSMGTALCLCSMENFDPMGIHTGDSIVVCPTQTLSNKEYQMFRDASIKIIQELKIEGGCNVQFALDPESEKFYVIEINPRVSRSSTLASKASGYPIARVSAMIAVGFYLHEIQIANTSASFEPTFDYIITKIPRFSFDKFKKAHRNLSSQMKSTGEVMGIGRNLEESFLKAIRSLETNAFHIWLSKFDKILTQNLLKILGSESDERVFVIAELMRRGESVDYINSITKIDVFFLKKIQNIVDFENELKKEIAVHKNIDKNVLIKFKKMGFSDKYISCLYKKSVSEIIEFRKTCDMYPVYKMIDTCAGEFTSYVPYFYSTYHGEENEALNSNNIKKPKIIVLGSGPIRIGQGIEFDYSTVHAIKALKKLGYEVIVINNNPSTVSTDYLLTDKLYFEPITLEDIINIYEIEKPVGIIVTLGGQTPINIAKDLSNLGVKIIGTGIEALHKSEDRKSFDMCLNSLNIPRPFGDTITNITEACDVANRIGYPIIVRPSFVLGGRAMQIINTELELKKYLVDAVEISDGNTILIDKYVFGKELEVDAVCDGTDVFIPGIIEHVEKTGVHSGDSISVYPTFSVSDRIKETIIEYTQKIGLKIGIIGPFNIQFIVAPDDSNIDKVYVIEVNPRASRTIPFLSKACNIDIADISTKVQVGISLKQQEVFNKNIAIKPTHWYVKVPVFSFIKIFGADINLTPEMKSTGEAIGHASSLNHAFYKAMIAAGYKLKTHGSVLVTVGDNDKKDVIPYVRRLINLGFIINSTQKTGLFLEKNGINTQIYKKISQGSEEILELLHKKRLTYVINTVSTSEINNTDGFLIRRCAIENGIPVFTSLGTLDVLLNSLENINK